MPTEARRGIRSPGAEVTGVSDLPNVGADIWTLQDQKTPLTTEPFLLSQNFSNDAYSLYSGLQYASVAYASLEQITPVLTSM